MRSVEFNNGWIDTHCHLADERLLPHNILANAGQNHIGCLISSALCRSEYDFHRALQSPLLRWTAGIHPFYDKSTMDDFDTLVELCDRKEIIGIGEIGLDARKPNGDYQEKLLKLQLDVAKQYNLPVVFHVVKRHNELSRILRDDFPGIRGTIHGFNGSIELFRQYRKLGMFISIGGRLADHESLKEIISSGCYMLETDAPYQKPSFIDDDIFTPLYLPLIADRISTLTGTPLQTLMDTQRRNVLELFGL